jgi:hypothetical protein
MGMNKFIALRAQARNDALAVDQRLRAAERDKLTLGARSPCGEGCRFSMAEGLPERAAGSKPARSAGGSPSLNIHDFSLYS